MMIMKARMLDYPLLTLVLPFSVVCFLACHPSSTPPPAEPTELSAEASQKEAQKAAETAQEPSIDRNKCGMPESLRESDWPRTLTELVSEEPDPAPPGSFTIAVLPDTQYYASCGESHFPEQGRWLAELTDKRNIVAAIHLGDITEHNTKAEWEYVQRSLSPLFDRLPLFLATGNHDYGDGGTANKRTTLFSAYFGKPHAATAKTLAETMTEGDVENAYFRLTLPKVTLGVLVLGWSPNAATVAWAKKALAKYPQDRKIFATHAYLFHDSSRYDFSQKGTDQDWNPLTYGTAKKDPKLPYSKDNIAVDAAYDGEMLWTELLADTPGLFLTLNGHVLKNGTGLLTSQNKLGQKVHQVLVNYQMLNEGGLGYLRLIEFSPDGARMQMKTFSPSLQKYSLAQDQHFLLPIEPPLY
jgi:hypothetical protein